MTFPPLLIDGATVIACADLHSHPPLGRTRHTLAGEVRSDFSALAFATYANSHGVLLLYCDETGTAVSDTWTRILTMQSLRPTSNSET